LTKRVDELQATLEQKTERIETLETEIERLIDELAARDRETEQSTRKNPVLRERPVMTQGHPPC